MWLIVEDENDGTVIEALLQAKKFGIQVRVLKPTGRSGGISRLEKELKRLIQTALESRRSGDCVAVLHDADLRTQQDRAIYDRIRAQCAKHKQDVALIVAQDELESWLLADSGICKWLGIKPKNWDEQAWPSHTITEYLRKKDKGLRYEGRGRAELLKHVTGTGDKFSPSMAKAVKFLNKTSCMQSNASTKTRSQRFPKKSAG